MTNPSPNLPTTPETAVAGTATGRRRLSVPVLLIWYTVLWVALWGQITWANVLGGLAVAIGVVSIVRLPGAHLTSFSVGRIRPVRAVIYVVYFLFLVVRSNLQLAWQVITPAATVRTGILRVRLEHCSDSLVTLIANSFTLTPGSITIDIRRLSETTDGAVVYVHLISVSDPEAERKSLVNLARLAIRAFGTDAALEVLEENNR